MDLEDMFTGIVYLTDSIIGSIVFFILSLMASSCYHHVLNKADQSSSIASPFIHILSVGVNIMWIVTALIFVIHIYRRYLHY